MTNKFDQSINWNVKDALQGDTLNNIIDNQPKYPYGIASINIDGELNIGMMIRTAVIFAASDFIIVGKKKYDKRSTVGGHNYINIVKTEQQDFLTTLTRMDMFPVLIETSGDKLLNRETFSQLFYRQSPDLKIINPCFVFGSESEGIPPSLLSSYPEDTYRIDMPGVLRSLNVSSCCAIVAHNYVQYLRSM